MIKFMTDGYRQSLTSFFMIQHPLVSKRLLFNSIGVFFLQLVLFYLCSQIQLNRKHSNLYILIIKNKMIQQQTLQASISILQGHEKVSNLKIFKSLQIISKTLQQYVNNPQALPSEAFIPCCLFVAPKKFKQIFNINQPEQFLDQVPAKTSYKLCLQLYLKCILKLLLQSSQQIKHIIITGMAQSIPLLIPFKILLKKWIKGIIDIWASSAQDLNLALRCSLFITQICRFFGENDQNNFMWTLRRMYVAYFENSKQISWRNYEHVNFMVNCICEIVKIEPDRSYYVLFGYLRSITLQIDKVNKSKRKQKVQLINKLYSNQILNSFKLFIAVISRVNAEELTALIYPLCELIVGYQRISESPQFIPLKLHLLEYELNMSETLHIYIPHTLQMIEKFLGLSMFTKKLKKKSQKIQANIQLAYRLSPSELQQALLVNQIFESLLNKIYQFVNIVSKMVAGPQILQKLAQVLKHNNYIFSEYKIKANKAYQAIREDTDELYEQRHGKKMKITATKAIKEFENYLFTLCQPKNKNTNEVLKCPQMLKTRKGEAEEMIRQKLAAEEEGEQAQEEQDQEDIQDDDEVNSGWEEASEGASQIDERQLMEEEESQDQEEISYEGDPEDADEVARQWSEQQWDSQDDI